MDGIINLLKILYHKNKLFFIITIAMSLLILAGCATSGSSPPSGPVGGGCG